MEELKRQNEQHYHNDRLDLEGGILSVGVYQGSVM